MFSYLNNKFVIFIAELEKYEDRPSIANSPDIQIAPDICADVLLDDPVNLSATDDTSLSANDGDSVKSEPKWVQDYQFQSDLARLKISNDPAEWTVAQVKHWLQYAVRQFNLVSTLFMPIRMYLVCNLC